MGLSKPTPPPPRPSMIPSTAPPSSGKRQIDIFADMYTHGIDKDILRLLRRLFLPTEPAGEIDTIVDSSRGGYAAATPTMLSSVSPSKVSPAHKFLAEHLGDYRAVKDRFDAIFPKMAFSLGEDVRRALTTLLVDRRFSLHPANTPEPATYRVTAIGKGENFTPFVYIVKVLPDGEEEERTIGMPLFLLMSQITAR